MFLKEVRGFPGDSDSQKKWSQIIPGSEIVVFFFWQNIDLLVYLFKAASSEFFFSSFM